MGMGTPILPTNLAGHVLRGCHYSTSFSAVDASLHELGDPLRKGREYFSFRASRGPDEVDLKSVTLFWEVRPVMATPGFSSFQYRFKRGEGSEQSRFQNKPGVQYSGGMDGQRTTLHNPGWFLTQMTAWPSN